MLEGPRVEERVRRRAEAGTHAGAVAAGAAMVQARRALCAQCGGPRARAGRGRAMSCDAAVRRCGDADACVQGGANSTQLDRGLSR